MPKLRSLLKQKNFSLLWFSQVISNFGDRLNQMALIGLVYARTPGSTMELAKLLSFTILPVFLIGPFAGIYVDRWDKKHIMITCDLLRGALVLLIPFTIAYTKTILPVYVMVFIVFSITRFFLTSKLSIIPDVVSQDNLLLANSLTSTTMMIATVIGFGFGGVIVERLGVKGGFYIDAATYFISAVMLFFVTLRLKDKRDFSDAPKKIKLLLKKTIIGDIREGIVYLKDNKDIRMVGNTMFLVMAGVGAIYIIIIVFIQEALRSSTAHLGYLAMCMGGGLFLGSVGYGRFGVKLCKRKVINAGLFFTGAIIIIFVELLKVYPAFFIAAFLSAILGLFASPIVVSSNTLLHEVMAKEMRGRIFSSLEIIMHIAFLMFMVITSFAAERFSKEWILVSIGAIFSLIGLVRFFRVKAEKRGAGNP